MPDIPDILSKLSAETKRKCEQIEDDKNCIAKGDCYWAKISLTNSKCFSINDTNFASIIENDLYYTAPIPFDDSQYDVLYLLKANKDNFIRFAQQNESFKQLIGNEEFMELLILIRTDRQAYNTVVEFFKSRFSKENLKNLIPIFLENKLDEFEQKKLRSGREKKPNLTPQLNTIQGLNKVPKENPVHSVAGGKIPGKIDGGAEGQIVYESKNLETAGDGGGVKSDMQVYANADRKRTPGLPTRKQPFNIEEELRRSKLPEQKFPGFWGQAEALN
jgi:hypothetical protein